MAHRPPRPLDWCGSGPKGSVAPWSDSAPPLSHDISFAPANDAYVPQPGVRCPVGRSGGLAVRSCSDDPPNSTRSEVREEALGGCGCCFLKQPHSYIVAAQETYYLLSKATKERCAASVPGRGFVPNRYFQDFSDSASADALRDA